MSHNQQNFAEKMREMGFRFTMQRQLILDAICQTDGHVSIQEINRYVQEKAPSVNQATVYRTVGFLQEHQFITRSEIGGKIVFEIAEPTPHHHLICRQCGHVDDLDNHHLQELLQHLDQDHGFLADINHLTISGLCAHCRD